MYRYQDELEPLINAAKERGHSTYTDVCAYLPDEGGDPAMVEDLILAMQDYGFDIVDDARHDDEPAEPMTAMMLEPLASASSRDPIRMYLSQMGNIPLLSREKEIYLAKQIEVTRKWFRRIMLESDFALNIAVETIHKVRNGELPFERTLRTSETENVRKEQILGRMPLNLPTIERLLADNRKDFEETRNPARSTEEVTVIKARMKVRRRKLAMLVEEAQRPDAAPAAGAEADGSDRPPDHRPASVPGPSGPPQRPGRLPRPGRAGA